MANPRSNLTTLKQPLAIRTDCITPQPNTLHVWQDLSWSNGDFTAKTADGTVLLSCNGKAWRLGLPGDGHMVMAVRPRWSLGKVKLDCTFNNAAADGEGQEVTLEVRGQDYQSSVTDISCGERKVAVVRRVFDKGGKGGNWLFKPEYEVDVAGGLDMAMVSYPLVPVDEKGGDLESGARADACYRLLVIVIIMAKIIQSRWDTGPVRNETSGWCERSLVRKISGKNKESVHRDGLL